jgi:hypothetical protein
MSSNLDQLPSTAPKADKDEYATLLRSANSMRASAQGIYIHNGVNRYCGNNSLQYFTTGIDVVAPKDAQYVERRYEVLRDTDGSWQRHYRATMTGNSWRAITYT